MFYLFFAGINAILRNKYFKRLVVFQSKLRTVFKFSEKQKTQAFLAFKPKKI